MGHYSLSQVADGLVLVFVVSNMLSLGMDVTMRQILDPLRNPASTTKALLANFVIVPLVACVLLWIIHPIAGRGIGLILLATAAGDPFVTKVSQISRGDPVYTLALMVALQIITVLYMPVVVPLLLPGVEVNPISIAKPLIITMLVPLALGMLVKAFFEAAAQRLSRPIDIFSSVVIAIALTMILAINSDAILATWGSHSILAGAILVWAGMAAGYFLGGPGQGERSVLGLCTAIRGYSAALIVGVSNFRGNADVVLMIVISLAVAIVTVLPFAGIVLRRMAAQRNAIEGLASRSTTKVQ